MPTYTQVSLMGKILLHGYILSLRMDSTESLEKHFFLTVFKYDLIHQHVKCHVTTCLRSFIYPVYPLTVRISIFT